MRKQRKKHLKRVKTPYWQKIIIVLFTLCGLLFSAESLAMVSHEYQPDLKLNQQGNQLIVTWDKYFYPALYEVNVWLKQPQGDSVEPLKLVTYRTFEPKLIVNANFPLLTYWQVSVKGLFHRSLSSSDKTLLAQAISKTDDDIKISKPNIISLYPANNPASLLPMLRWTVVPRAVQYELELFVQPPDQSNGILPSSNHILITRDVFTNGFQLNLSQYQNNHYYWRVRALDLNGDPIGMFSDTAELYTDNNKIETLKPPLLNNINANGLATPLYPVFNFIPIYGAQTYELEITDAIPENLNGIEPSQYRIASMQVTGATDFYLEKPMATPGTYYWRVRGIDDSGNPIGVFSDASQFAVDLSKGAYACTLGDSITHGGGGISYSPADVEYDYQTYLNFPVVNVGKSGDTSEATNARFEQDVLPYHPKYLIIMTGTNSLRGGVPASEVIRDLVNIRDKCLTYGIRPIFLTLPPINPVQIYKAFSEESVPNWKEEILATNEFIRKQHYMIDLAPYLTDENGELPVYYAADGLHFDIEGKKVMAQVINANWERVTR